MHLIFKIIVDVLSASISDLIGTYVVAYFDCRVIDCLQEIQVKGMTEKPSLEG